MAAPLHLDLHLSNFDNFRGHRKGERVKHACFLP
jgi:hypothetical protein